MGNFSDRIFDRRRVRLNQKPSFVVSTPNVYLRSPSMSKPITKAPTPDPKLKGVKGGNCNRTACQAPDAHAWSMNNQAYYCDDCARMLNREPGNHAYWKAQYGVDRFVFRIETLTDAERALWAAKNAHIPEA
jgi:hypothetical protein